MASPAAADALRCPAADALAAAAGDCSSGIRPPSPVTEPTRQAALTITYGESVPAAPMASPSAASAVSPATVTVASLEPTPSSAERTGTTCADDVARAPSREPVQAPAEERARAADIPRPASDRSKRGKRKMKRRQAHIDQTEERHDDSYCDDGGDYEPGRKRSREDADAGFGQDVFSEAEYYFENGLRKVYPYYYTYLTHCKGRWTGRNIVDVFAAEYRNNTREHHAKSVASGRLKINGHMVSPDYVFKGCNELVSNLVHRHEVPVSAAPIQFLKLTDELVVINKPSSMPVHPCGRYRHNTIAFMLGKEHGLQNLRTLYRLDRLTSGVLIMARTHATAERMMRQINERKVSKVYVCRVDGEFPSTAECTEPMDRVHHTLGAWRVKAGGKPSRTSFERVSCDGRTSVVKCYPHTGRTHQIRVHLQFLGFPITNDPLYNHPVWGPDKGKGCSYGKTDEQLYTDLLAVHTVENYTELQVAADDSPRRDPASTFDAAKLMYDADCDQCSVKYKDPRPEELVMYLHALSYKGPDWEFTTDLPEWAKDNWQPQDTQ